MGNAVLMIGNFLSSSLGTSFVCEDLARQLSKNGWHVISASDRSSRLARIADMVYTSWSQRNRYAVAQVDVYSGFAYLWAETVCWILRRAAKPYVLTLHGGNLPAFARRWPSRFLRFLRSAATVTTPSKYLLEQLKNYRQDLVLLPNALDLNRYEFRLRKQANPSLVWLRAFHDIYNPTLAPKVLALLPDLTHARLIMAGPDKGDGSFQRTKNTASELGVTGNILFPGRIAKNEVPSFLQKGDIFINTTNVDNAPVSVLEAMACGLCVVSTNVGGIPYLLEHEQNALLVPPDNPGALASAIRRILKEPGLAETISSNARKKAEGFDWSCVLPQWESILNASHH